MKEYSERYLHCKSVAESNRRAEKRELDDFITIYNLVDPVTLFPKYNLPTLESACYLDTVASRVPLMYQIISLPIAEDMKLKLEILYAQMYSGKLYCNHNRIYLGGKEFTVHENFIDFGGAN